jgi:hypothetical protein
VSYITCPLIKTDFLEKTFCPLYNGQENNVKGIYTNGIQKSCCVNIGSELKRVEI